MVFAMRTRARAGVRAVPVAARAAAPLRRGPAPARADVGVRFPPPPPRVHPTHTDHGHPSPISPDCARTRGRTPLLGAFVPASLPLPAPTAPSPPLPQRPDFPRRRRPPEPNANGRGLTGRGGLLLQGWAGEESTKEIFDDLENPTEDEFEAARKKMREESKKRLAEAAAEQAAKADFKASDK